MEVSRADGRSQNQLRPLACSYSVLHRAHGSARWSQGDTIVLAAVYGPKAGTKKNESPEKASIEVIWKPMFGPIGKAEKEREMILMRTLRSICLLNVHPNTTTSVIIQLLTCAINAACAALVDASIPLKYLSVAVCCGVTDKGLVMFDPTKIEEEELQATVCLVFPSSSKLVSPSGHLVENEPKDNGVITSVTHGQARKIQET
ncbi:Exosome complex exonuclease RRP46-like protein [Nymphaea thermarum]|nr:Exosome complex exonuclease RRP46-like protein [Nymphaea thermarum]